MLPGGSGGTCASMPVMYVAIGRRLGYPMKLVDAKEHLFCRWEDGKERFNIDGATNGGVDYPEDSYYRTWPKPISDAEMATGVFLHSRSPTEELAGFMHSRGMCLDANNRLPEARAAFAEAHRLEPRSTNTMNALLAMCSKGRPRGPVPRRPIPPQDDPNLPPDIRKQLTAPDPTPKTPVPGQVPGTGLPK